MTDRTQDILAFANAIVSLFLFPSLSLSLIFDGMSARMHVCVCVCDRVKEIHNMRIFIINSMLLLSHTIIHT